MKPEITFRLAMLCLLLFLGCNLTLPGIQKASATPNPLLLPVSLETNLQLATGLDLKLPFKPGSEWQTTSGWDGSNHQQNYNYGAIDFVPVGRSCLGEPILAAAHGWISKVEEHGIFIDHRVNDYHTLYAHLDSVNPKLRVGDEVFHGTEVGKCGGYPNFTPHLHFLLFKGTWDESDGVIPIPIDGITDQNRLKSNQRGLYSTNKANPVSDYSDYNGDGKPDLYAIAKTGGGSGKTDVYILNGADNYQSYLLNAGTALGYTDNSAWVFSLADYNGDGKPDLYAIAKTGSGSGKTDVYILNGADNYQSYLLVNATILGYTEGPASVDHRFRERAG